jgi:hypothetical protein
MNPSSASSVKEVTRMRSRFLTYTTLLLGGGFLLAETLAFSSGGALLILALIGLTLHEYRTERVVHALEVGERREDDAISTRRSVPAGA